MGVVSPNGIGLDSFEHAIRDGKTGIRRIPALEDLGFRCTIGGIPPLSDHTTGQYLTPLEIKRIPADGIRYGIVSAIMAWQDAGFEIPGHSTSDPDWDSGTIFGAGMPGADVVAQAVRYVDQLRVKKLGSMTVPNTMSSGISAHIGGKLGLGNQVTTNSSACSSGTESLLMGFNHIKAGRAKRMLCGACDSAGTMVRAGFDAMRVLNQWQNHEPHRASRPMSASAKGFVPSGGAGALLLEDYESAIARNARIYAEILGGYINSGGQRRGGTMTAPSHLAVQRCIEGAIYHSNLETNQIDVISGHLTATAFDPMEVNIWVKSMGLSKTKFPKINSLKSMTGHCLSAAGAIEAIAAVLQVNKGFVHPSVNCEDLHPDISKSIASRCIPNTVQNMPIQHIISSSFGFGDVNSCVVFKKY
jgi:3-oxoacyl-(acyl-carrier-protein) synthase